MDLDFENLDLNPAVSTDRIYVSWDERWDVPRYVDNYLRERRLRLDNELRARICDSIGRYPYKGVLKKDDLDYYLDTQTADLKAEAEATEHEKSF
jgi:hypothetical protein